MLCIMGLNPWSVGCAENMYSPSLWPHFKIRVTFILQKFNIFVVIILFPSEFLGLISSFLTVPF